MKRMAIFGVVLLALSSVLLIGAGGEDNSGNLDPHSHKNLPFAVVKNETGANEKIYYGELLDGLDRYLLIANSDADDQIDSTSKKDTLYLILCPGPGQYDITRYIPYGSHVDSVKKTDTTDNLGQIFDTIINITRGGLALYHFDPVTADSSYSGITLSYNKATYAVNGRKIAVDKFGRVHICYTDSTDGKVNVWYARSDDGGLHWQKQKVADSAYVPTIAVDTFGIPWVSYMTLDQRDLYFWSEGVCKKVMHVSPGNEISNAPAVALDFNQSVGVIYYSSRNTKEMDMLGFELPSLDTIYTNTQTEFFGIGPISCCIGRPLGSGVAVAGCGNKYRDDDGYFSYYKEFIKQLDWRLNPLQSLTYPLDMFEHEYSTGECVDPSIGNQGYEGYFAWVAYYNPSSRTIRYKKAQFPWYTFPNGDGDEIATLPSNYFAQSVQIADGVPFVVWERGNLTGTEHKIYYSYCLPGEGTSWSSPKRASNTDTNVVEFYPHVARDYENKKMYIIWTQYGNGINSSIGYNTITFEDMGWDSVRVIEPNGPPHSKKPGSYVLPYYILGTTINVIWSLREDDADSSFIYAKYDYPSGNWEYLGSTSGNDTTFDWKTTTAGGKCRVKVVVKYDNKYPYDISDADFEIRNLFVKPRGWEEYDPGGESPLSYDPGNSSKEVEWEAFSFNGLSSIDLEASLNGGNNFLSYSDSSSYDSTLTDTVVDGSDTLYAYTYTGTTYWTTPSTPTSNAFLRLMAVDTLDDTVYSYNFYPFAIAPAGGFVYSTYSNQDIMSLNDDGDKLGLVYTAQDPDTATRLSVLYMESEDGIDFTTPDTVGAGCWPAFSEGACFWQNTLGRTLNYAYQLNDTFSTPYPLLTIPIADSANLAAVGCLSENDTVHVVIRKNVVTDTSILGKDYAKFTWTTQYIRFLEESPNNPTTYTLVDSISLSTPLYDTTKTAASLVKLGSTLYMAYHVGSSCYLSTIIPPQHIKRFIGFGSSPQLSLSEGNLTYTYIGLSDTTLIRLWRYVDDTIWVERDTFSLDDDVNVLCEDCGLMYGVQREDTSIADLYVYDPISEDYYLTRTYQGHYQHPWIDDGSSEFAWINSYSDYVDSTTSYLHTERSDMNVIIPALYLESDDKRSPYTIYRDTCIHYTSVDVDSAQDSLKYRFPRLDDTKDYAVIVEFYTECDSATELKITLGSTVDTIQIPGNSYSWYEQDIASGTDTMNLKIERLSRYGFVPVSRVIVRERSEEGLFMISGVQGKDPGIIPFCLYQPYPNPFTDVATIRYSLPYATHVSLKVYDVTGRLVSKLIDEEVPAGVHTLRWEGRDNINRRCASGVYFVRYEADKYVAAKKMVLLK